MSEFVQLTKRQAVVAGLIADGFVDKEIAAQMGISFYTVRGHIKDIRDACGARNRAHIAAEWARGHIA